jgi:UDP-N-acetyl-D-mannosaminuronate dehydrogenase
VEQAMAAIAARPQAVVDRVLELLDEAGVPPRAARVLVLGVSYTPGIVDVRGSPAVEVLERLLALGVPVEYHDPFVPTLRLHDGLGMFSVRDPRAVAADVVVWLVAHPGADHQWLREHPLWLDGTYRGPDGPGRRVI